MFRRVRQKASTRQAEIRTPQAGQFLIGDNPGVTIHQNGTATEHGMAFGDATSMVLPIGPGHLPAPGPRSKKGTLDAATVDAPNYVQVKAAQRYVYMHPGRVLEAFALKTARMRSQG